ncbi:MAG: DsrE family protein [Actinomycetota bacterium]|jgi:tRNA 2-thiouridine synthesizing protein C|nr:DsrE family protein [Actinomycetota bacterium]MCL6092327.1 DsrE family protein [Actinomycetota bacterium]MDA8166965.1 DsrE family protein [Actinomycetota bacterium]
MEKNILFMFMRAPFGSIYYTEGLRAVVGMMSGLDEHKVTCVYMGDGAFYTLKGSDKSESAGYIKTIADISESHYYVDRESLAQRGIAESDIDDMFEVISRDDVSKLISDNDVVYDF